MNPEELLLKLGISRSRETAQDLINQGAVKINGQLVLPTDNIDLELGDRIDVGRHTTYVVANPT